MVLQKVKLDIKHDNISNDKIQQLSDPIDIGAKDGKPAKNCSAAIIVTYNPNTKKMVTLLPKKCEEGEKQKLGVLKQGMKDGASGTRREYWGKLVSIGGTNNSTSISNLDAVKKEFTDEAGVNSDIANKLIFLKSFDPNRQTKCYLAFLPYNEACKLRTDDSDETKRFLLDKSHGEIAELGWYDFSSVTLDKSGLIANYVKESIEKAIDKVNELEKHINTDLEQLQKPTRQKLDFTDFHKDIAHSHSENNISQKRKQYIAAFFKNFSGEIDINKIKGAYAANGMLRGEQEDVGEFLLPIIEDVYNKSIIYSVDNGSVSSFIKIF